MDFFEKSVRPDRLFFRVKRTVFYHLIDHELKENDLLLVTKIDRCSRNTLEFLKLQERLHKKGVRFALFE